ncbi:AraC-like ligand-binding domain-containing protein [Streptomyces sp. NPDC003470]|uniref:AraC-like ligand-binding domain-containing protein n=1 Tax=Streptomyces sp. NPDC059701 TaxID=3346914 RepID=UPI0036A02C52
MTDTTGRGALSTVEVAVPDRFEWWCDLIARDTAPTLISSSRAADFRAAVARMDMADVQLSVLSFPDLRSVRTPRLIRRSDPELLELAVIIKGSLRLSQERNDSRLGPGDLLFYDTSRPFDSHAVDDAGPAEALILHLPKSAVPLPAAATRRILARSVAAGSGLPGLMTRHLRDVVEGYRNGSLDADDVQHLGDATLHLAIATLAALTGDRPAEHTRRHVLLARIDSFIEHNLADVDLDPAAIAAHHHISLSYLHKLFRERDVTVAALIRQRRLERARADLEDPGLRHVPVHRIARRWGYRHATDLHRAFRAAYGITPGEHRRHHAGRPERYTERH